MGDKNNDFWEMLESEFFSNHDEKDMNGTVPVSYVVPSEENNRQILNIIFVIDVSGSMEGTRIAQVNYALENIFKEMKGRDDLNSTVKVGIMLFSESARWLTIRPIPLDDYVFSPITVQPSLTFYGKAFDALEEKLHKREFMNPDLGEYYSPLILFISDGEPIDIGDYPKSLERLKNNPWFKKASKYAIAVGNDARGQKVGKILSDFTGIKQNVRHVDEGAALCNLIEFIAIRASEVQTSMVSSAPGGYETSESIFKDVDETMFLWS